MKIVTFFLFSSCLFGISLAFWSLETDLQIGYEIYDRSYEINSVIQAILTATTRSNIVESDSTTQSAVIALNSIASQLRSAPITFFSELAYAASSRTNNENWHLSRLRTYHATYMKQLENLSNSTGPLTRLTAITNPSIIGTMQESLNRITRYSNLLMFGVEELTLKVAQVRANSSLLLTPLFIQDFVNESLSLDLQETLIQVRNSYLLLLSSVRDAARLTSAYGSMYDILDRSSTRDYANRNTSLFNFVDSYNRVRETLLTTVVSYRQMAQTGFTNFIQRVQSTYDDTIVRPRFEREQLPLILAFVDVVTTKVYNQSFFETSFDAMRDAIVDSYNNETNSVFVQDSMYRYAILKLLRESFVRHYASCLNELVSESQEGRNLLTSKYTYCIDERTSSITVVIPSTSSWLGVIRDNVNFILNQLNACLNGQISVAGRTAASDCIQTNAKNLQIYSAMMPGIVQMNLQPLVEGPQKIFQSCIGSVKSNSDNYEAFRGIYEKCSTSSPEASTQAPTTDYPTTTVAYEESTEPATQTAELEFEATTPEEATTLIEEDYGTADDGTA